MDRFDVAIIGTGPAGISAAITLKVRNKNLILIGDAEGSEKVKKAHAINNYPGLPGISGEELSKSFLSHLNALGITPTESRINQVFSMGDFFSLQTRENEMIEAKSIIIATGVNFGKPYAGEEEFLGRGVSYCATCDAMFYKDKTVAVIGQSPREEGEALFLSEVAKKTYYIPLYKEAPGLPESIETINDVPLSITGGMKADTLELKEHTLSVDGVFILRESIAPAQLVPGLKQEGNHINVTRSMETNIPGCFACGDITGTPYQYVKSAGEGNVAALSAVSYLEKHRA